MSNVFRIHLVFIPHKTAPFLGAEVPLPAITRYGHVYTMIEENDDFLELDFDYRKIKINCEKSGLSLFFDHALKRGSVARKANLLQIFPTVNIQASSFDLSEEVYRHVENYFDEQAGSFVPYDRNSQNCVYWAAQDLRAAGIETPETRWLTAGMFFSKMAKSPLSLGNLLYTKTNVPDAQIAQRTGSLAPQNSTSF